MAATPSDEPSSTRKRRRTGWGTTAPAQESKPVVETPTSFSTSAADIDPVIDTDPNGYNSKSMLAMTYQTRALCRIYVGSLDYYLSEGEIKQVFEAFGTVVTVDMPKEGDRSKGFCFVEFSTPQSAEMALTTMQGFVLKGRTIKVGRPTAVGLQPTFPVARSTGVLPVTPGIPAVAAATPTTNLQSAQNAISSINTTVPNPTQAGALAAAAMLSAKSSTAVDLTTILQKVSGQAGVSMPTPQQANAVLGGPPPNRIYVGNVPISLSNTDLQRIFEVFGTIINSQLIPSNEVPGTHRGYGFIEFAEPEQAKLAIETMSGFEVAGKSLKVNYATAFRYSTSMLPTSPTNSTGITSDDFAESTSTIDQSAENELNDVLSVSDPHVGSSSENVVSNNSPITKSEAALSNDVNYSKQYAISPTSESNPPAGKVIVLRNMVYPCDVDDSLQDEIKEECSKYGSVDSIVIKILQAASGSSPEVGIFVRFTSESASQLAIPSLHDRWFGGRQISCQQYDQNAFETGSFVLP